MREYLGGVLPPQTPLLYRGGVRRLPGPPLLFGNGLLPVRT